LILLRSRLFDCDIGIDAAEVLLLVAVYYSAQLRNTTPEAGSKRTIGRIDAFDAPFINQKSFASDIVRLTTPRQRHIVSGRHLKDL
jgi:hypothetical protein